MSLLTGVYGNVGHHILREKEKNRRRNTALAYYPKEDGLLLYCPLYVEHLEEYTKNRVQKDSALNLSQKILCGGVYYTNHIGLKVNKGEY